MPDSPAISVLMSVYNGGRHLYGATQSILMQRFTDFEFLILNDGSTDDSSVILQELAAGDARIKLIERENRGLVASLNELVMAASAPLIARMDCDDIALDTRLEKQIAFMRAHPEIGVLGTNTHELDDDDRLYACTDLHATDAAGLRAALATGSPICHPSVLMRTELVRSVGGYREAFRHAEDYDLWLRLSEISNLTNLPDRLLLYRRSIGQVSQKYGYAQTLAAVVAWEAHSLRLTGQKDPFDDIQAMPPIDVLADMFPAPGVYANIRRTFVSKIRYDKDILRGDKFGLLLDQAKASTRFDGAWRTVARLVKIGAFDRAWQLARALLPLR
jgi:glycosyltransferase involved in cell wall biosynthesis